MENIQCRLEDMVAAMGTYAPVDLQRSAEDDAVVITCKRCRKVEFVADGVWSNPDEMLTKVSDVVLQHMECGQPQRTQAAHARRRTIALEGV